MGTMDGESRDTVRRGAEDGIVERELTSSPIAACRGSEVRGRCDARWLRRVAVVVLQQTAELAIALDIGGRNRGCRRGNCDKAGFDS